MLRHLCLENNNEMIIKIVAEQVLGVFINRLSSESVFYYGE